jgi:hypothetical protein
MLATLLTALGLLLAVFGTFVYVTVGMTDPDEETMRLAKTAAVTGRWTVTAGTATYLVHAYATGAGTSPPMLTVLILAAVAAVATHVTKLRPPTPPRPV